MNRFNVDFNQAPLLVIWEVTRACALACRHCRASALDLRDPNELTLEEGKALLEDIQAMGTPIVVLTGGDPLQRSDLEDLIRYGKKLGLRMGTIPAGTPRLTRERLESIRESGVDQLAFSIDAPNAADHDAFRQVPGSFDLTLQGAEWASELGIPLQINTVFHRGNQHQITELSELVARLGVVFWEVFFLVPTGRGSELEGCSAEEMETIFAHLYDVSKTAPFVVKVTEAQHYRRYVQRQAEKKEQAGPLQEMRGTHGHPGSIGRSSKVVNAGKGFCFVDHVGDIQPSGFLPEVRGNVRTDSIADVYRKDEFFVDLRDPKKLEGRCATCGYRDTCGGSRSRAFAVTGNPFAEEPFCVLVGE
jgi:radical SAM protein